MLNILKLVDKASEKPFNMAIGTVVFAAKEVWRHPIATPATVFMGAMVLKAVDDHTIRRANTRDRVSTYIHEHMPHHTQPANTETTMPSEQPIESPQELVSNDR